ncbi:MAG: zinc-binding dehydrogenase [Steroidobacterales bacterium]
MHIVWTFNVLIYVLAIWEHYMAQPNAEELQQITALIDAGKVIARVQAISAFSDVQEAQQQLEHGHVQGKLVLDLELESDRVK